MSRRTRLALLSLISGGIALAGCSSQPTATTTTTTTTTGRSHTGASTSTSPRSTGTSAPRSRTAAPGATGAPAAATGPTGSTGIPACDDYLASYVACHRTAAIYPPDQIEGHYEAMRDSLLRDSQDPNTRPQLGGRCTALAQTLRQALHGRSCGPVSPATPASSSGKGG
ncbi:hypothetical protein CA260_14420 [Dyella jiangningensis]|uniref:Uncharacterized protein n=2 Tax=Dyella jiangningensis TaxID=1379159 RepID=A0A328P181_9GAMM|nr:hypothetical protein CA260_14420 [Dyella jiangningensis]